MLLNIAIGLVLANQLADPFTSNKSLRASSRSVLHLDAGLIDYSASLQNFETVECFVRLASRVS